MEREIKFRAFIKDENRIIDKITFHEFEDINTQFEDDELIFMQYTGLKDKNGVEIYEGDIVEFNNKKMIVVYQAPSFVMKLKINSKKSTTFILAPCENQLETVIGNIYENQNLLKG